MGKFISSYLVKSDAGIEYVAMHDRSEGGDEHYAFNVWSIVFNALQDAYCTPYCGADDG